MAGMSLIVICRDLLAPEMCAFNVVDDDNERRRYARGLTHLITLLDDAFVDAPVTLGTILEWVRLNIQTNYSEDEPSEPDDIEGTTTALTVHKSKGLEFDHVLIPHTWKKTESTQKGTEVAIQIQTSPQGTQQYQLRWRWHHKEQQFSNTTTQDTSFWDVDTQETICEETRLLYVAMTRARHTLHVFRSTDDHPHTWNDLFRLGEHHDQQH
jgi:DNA helicase-2/ATP-dependent DNA helicase PcrA